MKNVWNYLKNIKKMMKKYIKIFLYKYYMKF